MGNKTADKMHIGERAVIDRLEIGGSMRRRLLDIGLTSDTEVECVLENKSGDTKAYLICGAVIAIRTQDGKHIYLK